jgi:Clip-domain serine protease homolog masquerade
MNEKKRVDHATRMYEKLKNELTVSLSFPVNFLEMILGLLDTITSTENSKDCPGVCVHALATLICYEVLEDIKCPTASMKCCVESSSSGKRVLRNPMNLN